MKRTIVVGYDQSPSGDRALAQAGREAAWRDTAVTVVTGYHAIAVASPMGYMPADFQTTMKDAAEKIAGDGMRWLRNRYPGMPVDAKVVAGPTADSLAEAARNADLLGVGTPETVRKWCRQAEVDAGRRPGVTSEDSAELKRLKRENAELKRANAILRSASAFFAAELDRPQH